MDNNRKLLQFLNFMEQKCTNIKTRIDSLLVELSNQLSHSKNQGSQEQVCNKHCNSSMLNSELAKQACPIESDRNEYIDLVHTELRRIDPLVGRGDFETGQKCFDRKSTALKKEAVLNYSSDDQQCENAHSRQYIPVDDQSINVSLEKVQTIPHIKENDLEQNDTHNNLIVQNFQNDPNQDLLKIPKKFESYDEEQVKYNKGANIKDRIRNQNKDEFNMEKIQEYQEANKDRIRNQNKDCQESRKDKIKQYQESNKDKFKEANKDRMRNRNKIYQEANKDRISKKNKRENRIKEYRKMEDI